MSHTLINKSDQKSQKDTLDSHSERTCQKQQTKSSYGHFHFHFLFEHTLLYALAILKPDHACLIPARLHRIGNCKKNCRHESGVMPVVGRKLKGTFLDYYILTCFSPYSSLFSVQTNCSFKFPSKLWCKQAGIEQALSRNEQK